MRRLLQVIASLRLTVAGLVLSLLAALVIAWEDITGAPIMALPFALLSVNLTAALFVNPQFRRQPPLLVFHLALLAGLLLAALGRLTYLDGRIELAEGEVFSGEPVDARAGWLHPWGLDALRLQSESVAIDYSAYGAISQMRNAVRWQDRAGRWQKAELRIQEPLKVGGYRIYLTSGKGFAPVFEWVRPGGELTRGAVHLPAFPAFEDNQTSEWVLPGTDRTVWVQLRWSGQIIPAGQPARLLPPADHHLVVRSGSQRDELRPGARLALPEGELIYRGLRMWMGYRVFYDWTTPWLLAAAVLAVVAMAWHFARRFSSRPWTASP